MLDVAVVLDEIDWIFAALDDLFKVLFAGHHDEVTMSGSNLGEVAAIFNSKAVFIHPRSGF